MMWSFEVLEAYYVQNVVAQHLVWGAQAEV